MTTAQCRLIADLEFNDFFTLTNPLVLSGLLIGAMLPFLFAALTMLSVGKAATGIILEVRRQLSDGDHGAKLKQFANEAGDFAEKEEEREAECIDNGTEFVPAAWVCPDKSIKPDCDKCIEICTVASLMEMLLPGILAVMTPIGIGLLVGARCLGGLLMGSIATGFLLAVMMNNAGGAWDNSKKWVENEGPVIAGEKVEKKSDHHSAVVVGDTVGDPFKDTSGPALNILIKLMSVLSLTCAGIFSTDWDTWWSGVLVLIFEAFLCLVTFYFVWYNDNTQQRLEDVSNTSKLKKAEQDAKTQIEAHREDQLKMKNHLVECQLKDVIEILPPLLSFSVEKEFSLQKPDKNASAKVVRTYDGLVVAVTKMEGKEVRDNVKPSDANLKERLVALVHPK